jgi:hypothetical protein
MTATVVLASPSYFVFAKLNDYTASGRHRLVVLDPFVGGPDPIGSSVQVMKIVREISSPSALVGGRQGELTEWCCNAAAFDSITKSLFVSNEDSYLYRWNLDTNSLDEKFEMSNPLVSSYTPTAIGPDGAVYAINMGQLFAIQCQPTTSLVDATSPLSTSPIEPKTTTSTIPPTLPSSTTSTKSTSSTTSTKSTSSPFCLRSHKHKQRWKF